MRERSPRRKMRIAPRAVRQNGGRFVQSLRLRRSGNFFARARLGRGLRSPRGRGIGQICNFLAGVPVHRGDRFRIPGRNGRRLAISLKRRRWRRLAIGERSARRRGVGPAGLGPEGRNHRRPGVALRRRRRKRLRDNLGVSLRLRCQRRFDVCEWSARRQRVGAGGLGAGRRNRRGLGVGLRPGWGKRNNFRGGRDVGAVNGGSAAGPRLSCRSRLDMREWSARRKNVKIGLTRGVVKRNSAGFGIRHAISRRNHG